MRDLDNIDSYYERLLNEFSHLNPENSPCNGIENVIIIVNKKRWKKRKKHNVFEHAQQPTIAFRLSKVSKYKKQGSITKPSSMPELNKCTRLVPPRNKSDHRRDTKQNKYKQSLFQSKVIANVVSEHRFDNCFMNPFNYPSQTKWKIYKIESMCQLGATDDGCCCSCNSDAMFEAMKVLYACYKAKNCDNCCGVLCSYKLQEKRKLGESRKSMTSISRDKVLDGKTAAEKETILNEMAKARLPLLTGKTASEKALIDKTRKQLGLPPSPKNAAEKAKMRQTEVAGVITPLEGKTPAQKEEILRGQANFSLPLPEGRTASEKALIDKIKAKKGPRSVGKSPSAKALVGKIGAKSRRLSRVAPPILAPSERIRRVKAERLLTRLKGKTLEQREKILKGSAMTGLTLPEGQSPSEKKLIDKVRADLGLPMEPKTKSIREKHEQAAKAGLLQPLEGKTPAEKENILKGLQDLGIPLSEGRTPSEKALIAKVAASSLHPSKVVPLVLAPADQMRRAKAEGVLTPLTGKTPEQKEKILKALATRGIPFPERQTPSEKKIVVKVRADLGLPTEPKTKSIREKHEQAAKAGLLEPLEGKIPAEQEKILQGLHDHGIPLPEGQTLSEKALIAKVAAGSRHPSRVASPVLAPSGQMPRAKAEGLLTPLKGNRPEKKEKNKAESLPTVTSDKIRKGKAAGLFTPLTGKLPEQKEKILRARAMKGLPLPEDQSPSEKKLINKVRADLGLPMEPKTKSIRDKHEQAAKAGLLQPLEGKTPAEKEKTLKGLHDLGIPLPVGRTPSEKALIAKVRAGLRALSAVLASSEQKRKAKEEGLMTPLKGKQKEKNLKVLAKRGIPLPESQTPSEKKLVDKVRADRGLPTEPKTKSIREKHEQAAKAGLLEPLEGKIPTEQEKILQGLHDHGIPLPEGQTLSEKALIAKVAAGSRHPSRVASPVLAPSGQMPRAKAEGLLTPLKGNRPEKKEKNKAESLPTVTSDKIRKGKAAGLFTPLTGKTTEQKEKILQGLTEIDLPLPEGKTPSETAFIDKIKKESVIPDITPSEKLQKAKAAGLLTPLEGKSPDQKENILRGRVAAGFPLPMYKTPSEKALIQKIKDDTGYVTPSPPERLRRAKGAGLVTPLKGKTPSLKEKILRSMKADVPIPESETPSEKKLLSRLISRPLSVTRSEKLNAAKTAALLTPLEGKTSAQKEKIVEGSAKAGLPLSEGKTKSEKSMIARVKARTPPESKTPSEKSIIRTAKGKAPAEKERILKGLAETGLPLLVGTTASEKDLVKKIRAEVGLPIEPTPSAKKFKIRKKEQKVGVLASKRAAGIDAQEFHDIIETTTCDRSCGCDKKKIRFKHSYIKIRVTSPDIYSFCDCPDECLPGVKGGVLIDNEGIKATIGSAVGIPSYSMESINQVMPDEIVPNTDLSKTRTNYHNNLDDSKKPKYKVSSDLGLNNSNKMNYILNASSSDMNYSTRPYRIQSENIHGPSSIAQYPGRASKSDWIVKSLRDLQSLDDVYKEPTSKLNSASSYETILIIKNDMSLSTSTSNSMDSISLISVIDSSISSSSAQYSGYESTNDLLSINSLDGPTTSDDAMNHPEIAGERDGNMRAVGPQHYTISRMSHLEANFGNKKLRKRKASSETEDPVVLFNELPRKLDVSKIMFEIMSKKRFAEAPSIFIIVPTSDDDEEQGSSNCVDSITSIPSNEYHFTASTTNLVDLDLLRRPSFTECDEQVCGKGKKFYMQEISSSNDTETMLQKEPVKVLRLVGKTDDELCQMSTPNQIARKMPTIDSACSSYKDHCAANVISSQITPVLRKDNSSSWFCLPSFLKTSTESSARKTPPCFSPNTVLPNNPRQQCCSQQNQKTKSPSPCSSYLRPQDDFEKERNRSVKVQKPSTAFCDGDTAPKKAGGFCSCKTASSELSCGRPCCDFSCSPVPADHCHPNGRSQQHQTTVSTSPCCVNPPDDSEETCCPSAKRAGDKKAGGFCSCKTASSELSCGRPCCDFSCSPVPADHRQPHGRSQQHQTTVSTSPCCVKPPADSEETCCPSAKRAGAKKAGGFCSCKTASSELSCGRPCYDFSCSPVPADHRQPHGRSQQHQTTVSTSPCCVKPPADSEETCCPSAKRAGAKKAGK